MEGLAMLNGTVTANQYKDPLVDLIARFDVPFYIIETGRHANNMAFAEIHARQREVADEAPSPSSPMARPKTSSISAG